jgi:hypothetical protein
MVVVVVDVGVVLVLGEVDIAVVDVVVVVPTDSDDEAPHAPTVSAAAIAVRTTTRRCPTLIDDLPRPHGIRGRDLSHPRPATESSSLVDAATPRCCATPRRSR